MKAILMKELKIILKEKVSYIFLLGMPLVFIVMFSSIFGGSNDDSKITLRVLDQDQSTASQAFIKQMSAIKGMDVKKEASSSLTDQLNKIKKGQESSVIVIPKGFEAAMKSDRQANIKLYQDPAAAASVAPIQSVLKNMTNAYQEQKLSGTLTAMGQSKEQVKHTLSSPIQVKNINTTSDNFKAIDQVVPGMTVMFVFYIIISMSRRFVKEKESGVLSRVQTTAVQPMQYLIGMWIPFVLTVIAQCVILFGFGHYVYHLRLGDIAALAAIVICLSICGTGIGLAISVLAPSENIAMVLAQIFSLGGAMIGGLWMPSYLMPKLIQTIGHYTPQYWAQKGLQDVVAHGAHLGGVIPTLAILFGIGLVGLFVAVLRFPGYLRSATN